MSEREDISGLSSLDPAIAMKAQQIQKMPPQQAIQFLLSNGVDSRTASMVMKNMMLKKSAQAQQKPGQPPPTTVAQDIDNHINQIATQHAQGLGGLPVSGDLFKGDTQGMAGGGIVHFDDGGYTSGPPLGAPGETSPLDTGAMQQYIISQNMANQQAQAQAQQAAQMQQQYAQAGLNLKSGGIVYFNGGGSPENIIDPNTGYAYGDNQYINSPGMDPTGIIPTPAGLVSFGRQMIQPQGISADPNPIQGVAPPAVAAAKALGQGVAQGQAPQGPPQGPPVPPQAAQPPKPPVPPQAPPGVPPAVQAQAGARSSGPVGPYGANGLPASINQQLQAGQSAVDQAQSAVKSPYQNFADIQDLAVKNGVGAAAQAHLDYLNNFDQQLQQYKKQGNYAAIAQAGFAMAQAATVNPHGGFLGALAVGGETAARGFEKNLSDYRNLQMQIENQKYMVQMAQEKLTTDNTKLAYEQSEKQQAHLDSLVGRQMTAADNMVGRLVTKQSAEIMANATRSLRQTPEQDFYESTKNMDPNSPQYQQMLKRLQDTRGAGSSVQAAGINANVREANNAANNQAKIQEALIRLRGSPNYQMALQMSQSSNPQIAARGQSEIQRLEQGVQTGASGVAFPALPPGVTITKNQ